jgi:uncharacterized protein (DUF433 family)
VLELVSPTLYDQGMVRTRSTSDSLVALTRDLAADAAGLSRRQAQYWATTGVAEPTIVQQVSPRKVVRLYAFEELMALLVAAELKRRGASLQKIRKIVHHLRTRGYQQPLTQLVFATIDREIYFQHSDGTWEYADNPSQIVMWEVLALEPLRARIRQAAARREDSVGRIERRRGTLGGKAVVAGTRIPVATIQQYLDRGRSTEQIVAALPGLETEDVESIRQSTSA